jgi:hypothetical protein
MNSLKFIIPFLLICFSVQGQQENDSLKKEDDIWQDILLDEVLITNEKLTPEQLEAQKQYLLLKRRVYRTYPYAKTGSEKLEELNRNLARLKNKRDRKKFLKITEKYMETQFEARLKNLSRKEGQILVKLINRQTGQTTYDLVKDLKSGWNAYWMNKTANLFNISLKVEYNPYKVQEDFLIENILLEAFERRFLPEQPPKNKIDYVKLKNIWKDAPTP